MATCHGRFTIRAIRHLDFQDWGTVAWDAIQKMQFENAAAHAKEAMNKEREFSDRSTVTSGPVLIPFGAGEKFATGRLGTNWKIDGAQTGGRFSVIHHQLLPRTLAAPLHRHHREDEYSYVLTGSFGALLGDDVVTAAPGTWVFKPRGQWHTFWNAGDTLCEIIEVISPGGFEDYFRELREIRPDKTRAALVRQKYELDMDLDSVPVLCARFGLI